MRFLRDGAVDRLAVLIVGVDDVAELRGDAFVTLDQQLDGGVAARRRRILVVLVHAHAPGGVDAGTDLEDDVVDGDVVFVQTADLDDRQQALRRLAVEVFEAEMRQNAVFVHQRHDVRGDAHYQQVQQRADLLEGNPVFLGVGLHEFESHAAARQFVERVGTIDPLGVQNGYGAGNFLGREVMVADDEIHALRLCIDYLFRGFDTAVQGDDKTYALAGCQVDALDRDTVTFGIAVGDVEHQVFMPDLAQELVHQCNGRTAVHVVVAVNHDLLIVTNGLLDPLDRLVHVLHQERVVEVGETGFKELVRLFYGVYASLYEQVRQHGRNPEHGSELRHRLGIALRFHYPSFFYRHTIYYLYILTFNISLKNFTTSLLTSSIGTLAPVSLSIEVAPRSVNPQGLMRENHSRSVVTFSANPCMVI